MQKPPNECDLVFRLNAICAWETYARLQFDLLSRSDVSFNSIHDRTKRAETGHILDDSCWGTTKLRSLCREELGMEPNASTAFLFVNKSQDCLLLYSIDADGDRTVTKKLEKGAFIVPAPEDDGSPFVILRRQFCRASSNRR